MYAAPVQADHRAGAFTFYRQRAVDEHESPFRPVHDDARIVPDGLADADADVDAVPARLTLQTILAGVLSGYHDLAVMPVQLTVVRVRALVVQADEVQVISCTMPGSAFSVSCKLLRYKFR